MNLTAAPSTADAIAWQSPQPLPASLLPSDSESLSEAVSTEGDVREKVKAGRRKAPTLHELSMALLKQRPNKLESLRQETPSLKIITDPSTANTTAPPCVTTTPTPTRPRLSSSISSAAMSRSQSSQSSPITPSIERRGSLADYNHPERASGLPTLAALGAMFAARSAGAEQGEVERKMQEVLRGDREMEERSRGNVGEEEVVPRERDVVATARPESKAPTDSSLGFPFPQPASKLTEYAPQTSPSTFSPLSMSSAPALPLSHPLEHIWTFYFQNPRIAAAPISSTTTNSVNPSAPRGYEAALRIMGVAQSVESFCHLFNWVKRPSQLEVMDSIHVFKDKIKPTWEDDRNRLGGRWQLTIQNPEVLDKCWTYLVLGLVGEELDEKDDITGAGSSSLHPLLPLPPRLLSLTPLDKLVVAIRPRGSRIQLWIRSKSNIEHVNSLGRRLIRLLELSSETPGIHLEFAPHSPEPSTATRGTTSPYLSIRNLASTSTFIASGGGGGGRSRTVSDVGIGNAWRGNGNVKAGIQGGVLSGVGGNFGREVGRKEKRGGFGGVEATEGRVW
ncbi:translation initiation factor 4E, partial [Phenoliferia sp. Uapishka_3]